MDPKKMKLPPDGAGVPPMAKQMMEKMCGGGEFGPAAMCQGMMVGKTAETAEYATPEVRKLFEEWARSLEKQVLAVLRARGPLDLATLASALEISPESALYLLGKLVGDGRATMGSIRATGARDAAL